MNHTLGLKLTHEQRPLKSSSGYEHVYSLRNMDAIDVESRKQQLDHDRDLERRYTAVHTFFASCEYFKVPGLRTNRTHVRHNLTAYPNSESMTK